MNLNEKIMHDATKKLYMDIIGEIVSYLTNYADAFEFLLELSESAYDLIIEVSENGGKITKGSIIKYFASKGGSVAKLTDGSRGECLSAAINLGIAASEIETLAGGPAGWAWYASSVILEGIETGGSCYIWRKNVEIDEKSQEIENDLSLKRIRKYSSMQSRPPTPHEILTDFKNIQEYLSRRIISPAVRTEGWSTPSSSPRGAPHAPTQQNLPNRLS
ncbi:hypothetical protein KPL78_06050 [Roseomonas sp. HJA6]|uniref:Uncharacterized protein n=1 Tax=Roseomonas alba TaxID=2846776 RepID=A0ABS7A526_9PROT|nr:hypothetical protein [Neoroseomonas alba]MBW6397404.1 hypothetical protein [Neoroseomonas alba]